jgi:glutamate racemase
MKIGIFDSGLGGLVITKSIVKKMPQYDIVYLGDTARVPYGDRSEATIYRYAQQAAEFLFKKDCQLVIFACNTVSASALRKLQRNYLPKHYPGRRILGVIIPTAEQAVEDYKSGRKVGIMATAVTVRSKAYVRELRKLDPKIKIYQKAAPLLVPLLESNSLNAIEPLLEDYLRPLMKQGIDSLILGCTHYPILTSQIRKIIGPEIKIYDQSNIIPQKLKNYLRRHPEVNKSLGRKRSRNFYVTKKNPEFIALSARLMGKSIKLKRLKMV